MNIRGILRRASAILMAVLIVIGTTPVSVYRAEEEQGTATLTVIADVNIVDVSVNDAEGNAMETYATPIEGGVLYDGLPAGSEYIITVEPKDNNTHAIYSVTDETSAEINDVILGGVYSQTITPTDGDALTRTIDIETFYDYTVIMDTSKGTVEVKDAEDNTIEGITDDTGNITSFKLSDKRGYTFSYSTDNDKFDSINGIDLGGVTTHTVDVDGSQLEANVGSNVDEIAFYSQIDQKITVNLPAEHLSMGNINFTEDGLGNTEFIVKKGSTPILTIDPKGNVFKSITVNGNPETIDDPDAIFTKAFSEIVSNQGVEVEFLEKHTVSFVVNGGDNAEITVNTAPMQSDMLISETQDVTLAVKAVTDGYYVSNIAIDGEELTVGDTTVVEGAYVHSFKMPQKDITVTIDITPLTDTRVEYTDEVLEWTGINFQTDVTNHKVVLPHTTEVVLSKTGYNVTLTKNSTATASVIVDKNGDTVTTITDVWAYATNPSVSLADSMIHYKLVNPLSIVIDETAPTVTNATEGTTLWYGPNSNNTRITVDATDTETAVTHVVYFSSEQNDVTTIKNGTPLTKNGNTYTFDAIYTDGVADATTYYIYAVNESDAYSEVRQVVGVDAEGPSISKMKADTTTAFLQKLFTNQETITVEVTASDAKSNVKSFRLGVIENGGEERSVDPVNVVYNNDDGTFTATYSLTLIQYKEYTIKAYATDNMNNECLAYTVCQDTQGNAVSGLIYFDITAPSITLKTTNATYPVSVDANKFYVKTANHGDAVTSTGFTMHLSAKDYTDDAEKPYVSGISKYTVAVNDIIVTTQDVSTAEKKVELENITITTADLLQEQQTGSYKITLTVYDIAGNQSSKTIYAYIDNTKPEVASVEYNNQMVTNTSNDYVFYGNTDMSITVNPIDAQDTDSGIKCIEYWFDNQDEDNASVILTQGNGRQVFKINIEEDNYKGALHVKTVDNVGFESDIKTFNIIRESNEKNNSTSDIDMKFAETALKDAKNNPLYTDSTEVEVTVTDTYSGIKSLSWKVVADYDTGNNTSGSANVAYSAQNGFSVNNDENSAPVTWTVSNSEKNIATEIKAKLPIKNDSNEIKVIVSITDNAGNTRNLEKVISIDKAVPVIEVSFDNTLESGFYTSRKATITVFERNFDASKVITTITNTDGTIPKLSEWGHVADTVNPDKSKHTATIEFAADGDYTLKVEAKDLGNIAAKAVEATPFTVDKTAPTVTIAYDNNNAINEKYFAAGRTATVTVTEHNFDANSVVVNGTATFGGGATAFPSVSGWSSNGDVHTTTLSFSQDALFKYDVSVTDKAGNAIQYVENEFSVDTTIPEITITGVEDMSANNGTVAPIVTITDENYDANGVTIELTGANQGRVEANGSFSDTDNGQVFNFADFAEEQSNDDLYTLMVTEIDKAGNTFEDSITFSVNRFGSVYTLSDELAAINGKYVKEAVDVVITETNVDGLDMETVKVVLTVNGTPKTLIRGEEYTISQSGGGGSWSQYEYRIGKELFQEDGAYSIAIYSVDDAGNVNENINETKEAEVFFGIDTVNPIITAIDLESGKTYEATAHTAVLSITDNLILGDVSIMVNGEPAEYTVNGTDYSFVLNEASSAYTIVVNVTDKAGNAATMTFEDVWVTTSAFVRVMNSPVALAVGGGVVGVAGIGTGAFFFLRSKNVIKVKRK
ncbi:MAG: hypothetical protein IJD24_05690 [Agathobacter sp.]|nr:hypothetical protein [Agathobacter sp.]